MNMNNICTTIDDFEHRQAILQELIDEIPSNDPKFANLKSLLSGLPENDLDRSRLSGIMNEHQTEWNQLKWQLNMALEANRKELERKQKDKDRFIPHAKNDRSIRCLGKILLYSHAPDLANP